MRPCHKCGNAIHNDVDVCPDCDELQDPPRRLPDLPETGSEEMRESSGESDSDLTVWSLITIVVVLAPALLGHLCFAEEAAIVGLAVTCVLVVAARFVVFM